MSALDILRRAPDLIRKGWAQGIGARDGGGQPVWPMDGAAAQWDAASAIAAVALVPPDEDGARIARRLFRRAIGDVSIESWNDAPERTRAQVLVAFDRAADLAATQENIERLTAACEATLLFHSAARWDEDAATRWRELAGTAPATTKALCDLQRAALRAVGRLS